MQNPVKFLTRVLAPDGQPEDSYPWEDLLAAMQEITSAAPTQEVESVLVAALRFEGRFCLTPTSSRPHRLSPEDMVKSLAIQALGKWGIIAHLVEIERIESTTRSPGLASVARATAQRLRQLRERNRAADSALDKAHESDSRIRLPKAQLGRRSTQPIEGRGAVSLVLRETETAEAWLNQFDPPDRQYASLLLETLELVPTAKLEQALARLVAAEVAGVKEGSVALFAVREIPTPKMPAQVAIADRQPEAGTGEEAQTKEQPDASSSDGGAESGSVPATPSRRRFRRFPPPPYFHPTNPTVRPDGVAPGGGVGSEGDIAHLIRDLAKQHGNRVLDHPSIHSMKETRCRLLLLIDDLIGSGTRVTNFLRSIVSNRTIKSWYSFGYIQIRVLVYAATSAGLARVEAEKRQNGVRYERLVGEGSSCWTDAQKEEVKRICAKYGERTSRRFMSLGYKKAFTSIVFEHKCPNTNPSTVLSRKA
jgi:hypothetical protein